MQQVTLCFLMRTMAGENEILLAMKKRGFGVGKWNGVGGKPQDGESIEKAAIREMQEEISVKADIGQLEKKGSLKFYFRSVVRVKQKSNLFCFTERARKEGSASVIASRFLLSA